MSNRLSFTVQSRRDLLLQLSALAATAALVPGCDPAPSEGKGDTEAPLDTDPMENRLVTIEPITPNEIHYVTSCCGTPEVDGAAWTLTFTDGIGETSLAVITLEQLNALPTRDREHTLMCIGSTPRSQKISNAIWSGLPLTEVFEQLGITLPEGTTTLRIDGHDGFSTGLPVEDLERPLWLVWRMNGAPIPLEHGFPARLLVPGRYGMKNPKWMTSIRFQAEPYQGFWESSGWSDAALYKPNTFIHYPRSSDMVYEGPLRLVGTAFAGGDPIQSVEISIDGGPWQPVPLDYNGGPDIWTLWHFEWEATAGTHTVQVRCVTVSGARSNDDAEPITDHSGWGGSMRAELPVV